MRKQFNQSLDENLQKDFAAFVESNTGGFADHLEAAIKLYLTLPKYFRMLLLSGDDEDLSYCLDLVAGLQGFPASKKRGGKKSPPKSA